MTDNLRNTWYQNILRWSSHFRNSRNDEIEKEIEKSPPSICSMKIETSYTSEEPWIDLNDITVSRRSNKGRVKSSKVRPRSFSDTSECRTIFHYFHPWRNDSLDTVLETLPDPNAHKIFDAVLKGSISELKKIVHDMNSDPDSLRGLVDASDSKSRRVLIFACAFGHLEIVEYLLTLGADPNTLDETGSITPLICAAVVGNDSIMNTLIEYGADINFGININAENGNGKKVPNRLWAPENEHESHTALMWAVKAKNIQSVEYLLRKGANPIDPKVNWKTPLHEAAYLGCHEILRLLIEFDMKAGKSQLLELRGGNLQNTALHIAVEEGHVASVDLLLSLGADPNKANVIGQTPLHVSARTKHYDAMESLIKANADVNNQDTNGKTALHLCVPVYRQAFTEHGEIVDCLELLLSSGADLDIQDEHGYTVFHLAVDNKFSSIVPILLKHGADLTLSINSGQTGLEMLVKKMPHAIRYVKESLDLAIRIAKKETTDPRCKLAFDFRAIMPTIEKRTLGVTPTSFRKEMELLSSFCSTGHKHLLSHPLIEAFILLKWQKAKGYFYLCFLATMLMVALYSYIVVKFYAQKCPISDSCTNTNEVQVKENFETSSNSPMFKDAKISISTIVLWWIVMLIVVAFCLKEMFQMLCLSPKRYFAFVENYIQIAFGGIAILTLIRIFSIIQFDESYCSCDRLSCLDYVIATTGIIISWFLVLLRIGKFPKLGLYVHMLFKVISNFVLFMTAYASVLVAFSLSLGILFSDEYENVAQSMLNTLIMMTGEISISYSSSFNSTIAESSPKVWIGNLSSVIFIARYVMFVLFVLLITIVLMNLLVGLAVSDIQGLQDMAKLDRLKRLVHAIYQLETMFAGGVTRILPPSWKYKLKNWLLLIQNENLYVYSFYPYNQTNQSIPHSLQMEALNIVERREDSRKSLKIVTDFELKLMEKVENVEVMLKLLSDKSGN